MNSGANTFLSLTSVSNGNDALGKVVVRVALTKRSGRQRMIYMPNDYGDDIFYIPMPDVVWEEDNDAL